MYIVVKTTKYGTAHTARVRRKWSVEKDPNTIVCESLDEQLEEVMAPKRVMVGFSLEERIKRAVWAMPDWELVAKLASIPVAKLKNIWECEFQTGVREFYLETRGISWKQRKISREIIERIEIQNAKVVTITTQEKT